MFIAAILVLTNITNIIVAATGIAPIVVA